MKRQRILYAILLAGPLLAGCGSDEEFTCVCRNTLTGSVIDESTVVAEDINEATEICDDRESFTIPDRCVIVEDQQ